MEIVLLSLAATSLAAWLYLSLFHGRFWLASERLSRGGAPPEPAAWPEVTAVVPARDEADVIEASLTSLLEQDYPGPFRILLVDDHSRDGTGDRARGLAGSHPRGDRLEVIAAGELPAGWVGKMWAVANGVAAAKDRTPGLEYLLLTDADIGHTSDNLRRLVARAEGDGLDLVSLMVKLSCRVGWERLLIPAFVYFFQKLYPFPRVNDPHARTAGAAGGCMLVRAAVLEASGGIAAIRGEIIDDCALGRQIKCQGPIWLGLAERQKSLRPYAGLGEIWDMVARTAYVQLRTSPLLLMGTVFGLALIYLVPPAVALTAPLHEEIAAGLLAAAAWFLMAVTFVPTLRLYGRSPLWAPALPFAGLLYLGMTLDSAWRHARGRGAGWKGRTLGDLTP